MITFTTDLTSRGQTEASFVHVQGNRENRLSAHLWQPAIMVPLRSAARGVVCQPHKIPVKLWQRFVPESVPSHEQRIVHSCPAQLGRQRKRDTLSTEDHVLLSGESAVRVRKLACLVPVPHQRNGGTAVDRPVTLLP